MPLVYCGRGGASKLLPLTDDTKVETSEPVTYCVRADGEAGPGGGPLPAPSRRHSSASFCLDAACCHGQGNGDAEPWTGLYALLGLSRCWWMYTVTSPPAAEHTADAMEEGVATEERGGAGPEVTGVGWSLPCSLSSLLAMNCRARAEGLARRLQAKVRLGGGTSAFEETSLVSPGPEDHYASMECRHSSLDDPHLDLLQGSSLRPIHVVTSEPTLHMCQPQQPHLAHLSEQDSDVYYDFDLASPDDAAEADDDTRATKEDLPEGEDERRPSEGGERPESGCVTSVTSPVMFDEDRGDEDDEGEEGMGELLPPEEALACSPDADLRAVRQILSCSSLSDAQAFSLDEESCGQNGECVVGGLGRGECRGPVGCYERGGVGSCGAGQVAAGTGGAGGHGNTCPRLPAPVARSGSCWCHHAPGTPPAVPRTSAGRLACYASPSLYEVSGSSSSSISSRSNGRPSWGREACQAEHCVMIDNEGHNKDDQGHHDAQTPRTLSPPAVPQDACPEAQLPTATIHDGAAADGEEAAEDALKPSPDGGGGDASASEAISGSWLAEPHLYPTSAAADTEAKGADDDEADLPPAEGEGGPEEDQDVIETLDEDEEGSGEEEANEEDIEEETILTGKFRNIRGYKERVRRLSEESEDVPPPPVTVIYYENESLPEQEEALLEQTAAAEEEPVSGPELASQLSELTVEHVGVQVDAAEAEGSSDEAAARSSSEETDSERVEDFKMRIKRSSSLKCGKTPPGTPGRKKIVRFADMLGLDLAAVRTFLGGGVPHVPRSAFWDLQVEKRASGGRGSITADAMVLVERRAGVPRRVLTPLFQQPGLHGNFLERVRTQRVVVESVDVGDDMSVRGVVRVLNLDFHKTVIVRYTFDHWRNYHETTATYIDGSYDGLTDQFSFLLWGSFLQDNGALVFCVRYHTLGQEFWDNNFGRNYTLQCYSPTAGPHVGGGSGVSRPQNSSMVQQHFESGGGASSSSSRSYHAFSGSPGSPTTPHDPWATRFF